MPRGVHVTRVLPILAKPSGTLKPLNKGPGFFNGKRRIKRSYVEDFDEVVKEFQQSPLSTTWRQKASEDVRQFVDDMEAQGTKLLPEEQLALLRNPTHYFSRPHNVPCNLRQQVYFPDFSVVMRRQTKYGPYYAQFEVPLWFSKLDLRGYLKQAYNVDVVHIRSYTLPAKVMRKPAKGPYSQGSLYRQKSKKRMTVQLVEPFEWPVKPEDLDKKPFDTELVQRASKRQQEDVEQLTNSYNLGLNRKHRKSIAEQAEQMLTGKTTWGPTWKSLPDKRRMMEGIVDKRNDKEMPSEAVTKDSRNDNARKKVDMTKGRVIRIF